MRSSSSAGVRQTIALLVLLWLCLSCGSSVRQRPEQSPTPAPLPPSLIDVGVRIDLAALARAAEPLVPSTIDQLREHQPVPDGRWGVRYVLARGPLSMRAAPDGRIITEVAVQYGVEGCARTRRAVIAGERVYWPCFSCGLNEPRRVARLRFDTTVSWTSDWRLKTRTVPAAPQYENRCAVTIFDIDVTGRVVDPQLRSQIATVAQTIDQQLAAQTVLRSQASAAWDALQAPIALGSDLWLDIRPTAIALGVPSGEGRTLRSTLRLTASPHVVHGRPARSRTPLPVAGAAGEGATGLRSAFQAHIPLASIAGEVAREITGRQYRVGSRLVTVRSASIRAAGHEVIVDLGISFVHPVLRSFEGNLSIRGTPVFDERRAVVRLDRLEYDLEADRRRMLFETADRLVHGELQQRLSDTVAWPVSGVLEDLRKRVTAGLNRPLAAGVTLHGTARSVTPQSIHVVGETILLTAILEGEATLELR